jgi:phosphoesterase RecJ-like protein
MKTDFGKTSTLLKQAQTIAIVGHIRPDGDSIGSSMALRYALLDMGKKTVDVFVDDHVPDNFFYFRDFYKIKDKDFITNNAWQKYDLLVIVDSSTEDRLGRCTQLRDHVKNVLVIDHHVNTTVMGDVVVSNPDHVSIGTMLYEYFTDPKTKIEITRDIATGLYTSMATDTGCFAQANTTSYSHRAAADLIDQGIDLETINYNNFRLYNRSILPGLGYALRNIKFFISGEVAVINIPHKVMKKFGLGGEMHQFKKYASEANGVRVGVIMTEREKGKFNVSLRSHGDADVATVAQSFGGGGHKNASGFVANGKTKSRKLLKEILARVEKCIKA